MWRRYGQPYSSQIGGGLATAEAIAATRWALSSYDSRQTRHTGRPENWLDEHHDEDDGGGSSGVPRVESSETIHKLLLFFTVELGARCCNISSQIGGGPGYS